MGSAAEPRNTENCKLPLQTAPIIKASLSTDDLYREEDSFSIPKTHLNLINKVFNGDIKTGHIDTASALTTAESFMQAVSSGFSVGAPDYDTPYYAALNNITKNVYAFSGAKNYQQLRDLTTALKDGDRIRTKAEFKKEAMQILDEYNVRFMATEYNTAVSGALNAAKWNTYEEAATHATSPSPSERGGERSVYLRYHTVGDARVRLEHQLLDGITRPMNDSFWSTHNPPLAWNCRCTTLRIPGSPDLTDPGTIPYVEIPKMFRVNLAKEQLVFPKSSPYFIGCPTHTVSTFVNNNLPKPIK